MVLAAPGPLLTPPPSSFPPKTPHRSYSAQIRSQNEEKNHAPKPYLALQIRERVLFIGTQFSILYTSMYSPAEAATLIPKTVPAPADKN